MYSPFEIVFNLRSLLYFKRSSLSKFKDDRHFLICKSNCFMFKNLEVAYLNLLYPCVYFFFCSWLAFNMNVLYLNSGDKFHVNWYHSVCR